MVIFATFAAYVILIQLRPRNGRRRERNDCTKNTDPCFHNLTLFAGSSDRVNIIAHGYALFNAYAIQNPTLFQQWHSKSNTARFAPPEDRQAGFQAFARRMAVRCRNGYMSNQL